MLYIKKSYNAKTVSKTSCFPSSRNLCRAFLVVRSPRTEAFFLLSLTGIPISSSIYLYPSPKTSSAFIPRILSPKILAQAVVIIAVSHSKDQSCISQALSFIYTLRSSPQVRFSSQKDISKSSKTPLLGGVLL